MAAVAEFLRMGGYAVFVWPAYAVAVLALGGLALASLRRYRDNRRTLELLQAQQPVRVRRGGGA